MNKLTSCPICKHRNPIIKWWHRKFGDWHNLYPYSNNSTGCDAYNKHFYICYNAEIIYIKCNDDLYNITYFYNQHIIFYEEKNYLDPIKIEDFIMDITDIDVEKILKRIKIHQFYS
jgi:hypothetical protein